MGKSTKIFLLGLLAGILATSFTVIKLNPLVNQLVVSVFWYQHANEKKALYLQGFNMAKRAIDQTVANYKGSKPLAVIVDIDETVLDNSPYETFLIKTGQNFTHKTWDKWVQQARANPTPGAVEFTQYAKQKGVEVFYITNRREKNRQYTLVNLQNQGFAYADSSHLLMRTTTSDKTARRQIVQSKYHVICYIGDSMGDFDQKYEDDKEGLLIYKDVDSFGTKYIVMPNPMYGHWIYLKYPKDIITDEQKAEYRIQLLED